MPPRRPSDRPLTMTSGRSIRRPDPKPSERPPPPDPAPEPPAALRDALEKAGGELGALTSRIRACDACGRASGNRVFGSGYPRAPIMLLKDAPAVEDVEAECAFTAEADALARAFGELRIPLSWVYATTSVRCGEAVPDLDAVKACATHLLVELEAVEPSVMVVFGERALESVRALDGRCGIAVPQDVARSEPVDLRPGLAVLLTESLPAGLRDRDAKRRLWEDLKRLPGLLDQGD